MNKLKPCPFCGGTAKKVYKSSGQTVHIECEQCRAQFPKSTNENAFDEAWNSRVERTCHAIKEWNMIRTIKGWQCSECGLAMAIAPKDEDMPERPDYCPWCGRKVVA